MKVSTQLHIILERASKQYINKHIDNYVNKLKDISERWKSWVKGKLSVKYIKGTKNTSLYPKLRTGELRSSISLKRPRLKYVKQIKSGKAQASITVPIYYKPLKDNYGELLNSSLKFKESSFYGWKDRVEQELESRLLSRAQGRL